MREAIRNAVIDALKKNGVDVSGVLVEHPGELAHGDYATGAALRYAKQAGMAPRVLAEKLVAAMGTIGGVEKAEIAGPGFINFHLSAAALGEGLARAISEDRWGANGTLKGEKIMIEYTDPNPFKEFHIGHLMSNAVGESLSRLLQFSGAEVKRANYQGDVGPHVAKAIWGIQKLGLDPADIASLGTAYAAGAKAYEEDETAKREIDEINKQLYEHSDASIDDVYAEGRETSLRHFEEIYSMLGTKFDYYFFESETAPKGLAIVRARPDVFEQSDGAIVYRGEKVGLHTRVFVTSKGLPTYETKDLGLAKLKSETWDFDTSITVTAHEQAGYFSVVLAAMKEVMPEIAAKIVHVTHGMMRFADGKMSSRTGNVITGESLLRELTEVAKERAKESRAENTDALAEQIAVAAVKYQILKQASGKDIIFDRERALSIEGDSGPYLQYTHARAHAIVEKAKEQRLTDRVHHITEPNDVARLAVRFPDIVGYAREKMEPHVVTSYLLELASAFNRWYARVRILDGSPEAGHRVALTDAVRKTLKNGLWILGIPAPERM